MEFIDFDKCERITSRAYGGRAGRKIAVLFRGEPWLLKFPESTREFPGNNKPNIHLPSYTTSPISEYIGSKIYASLDIPVHEVMLGSRDGKVVVACKDFAVDDRLLDFASIKNTIDEDTLAHGNSSRDSGEYISEVLRILDASDGFGELRQDAKKRFWDMFVTDAFILNNDRNNGNWGLLAKRYSIELAPVFDNGNAFFNKKNNSLVDSQVGDWVHIRSDVKAINSFYLDEHGKNIHPFKYLAKSDIPECVAAIKRFVSKLDMQAIAEVIDNVPCAAQGYEIISPERKEYYKSVLETAYRDGIEPAAIELGLIGEQANNNHPNLETAPSSLEATLQNAEQGAMAHNITTPAAQPKGKTR